MAQTDANTSAREPRLEPECRIEYGGEPATERAPEKSGLTLVTAVEGPPRCGRTPFRPAMSSSCQPTTPALDRLIAADPIERLVATIEVEIRLRSRRFSNPQLSLELDLLKSFKAELDEALRDARKGDVIGNVADAARLSRRPLSTVRRLCSKHGEKAGASFVEGEWSIHLPTFLRFQASLKSTRSDSGAEVDPTHDEFAQRLSGQATGRSRKLAR